MKLSRRAANIIHFILDQLIPPIIRDSKWFSVMVLYPVTRDKTNYFLDFRDRVHGMTSEDFSRYYAETSGLIDRDTDLGVESLTHLCAEIQNKNVLEVGAGRGALAIALSKRNSVTACDMSLSPDLRAAHKGIEWCEANAEQLPYADNSFDTVVCTHTLEHVRDFESALAELRRVSRDQVYIVVPLQRPYKYTPDLHIWYFPYPHSFLNHVRPNQGHYEYQILDGDLMYKEWH